MPEIICKLSCELIELSKMAKAGEFVMTGVEVGYMADRGRDKNGKPIRRRVHSGYTVWVTYPNKSEPQHCEMEMRCGPLCVLSPKSDDHQLGML